MAVDQRLRGHVRQRLREVQGPGGAGKGSALCTNKATIASHATWYQYSCTPAPRVHVVPDKPLACFLLCKGKHVCTLRLSGIGQPTPSVRACRTCVSAESDYRHVPALTSNALLNLLNPAHPVECVAGVRLVRVQTHGQTEVGHLTGSRRRAGPGAAGSNRVSAGGSAHAKPHGSKQQRRRERTTQSTAESGGGEDPLTPVRGAHAPATEYGNCTCPGPAPYLAGFALRTLATKPRGSVVEPLSSTLRGLRSCGGAGGRVGRQAGDMLHSSATLPPRHVLHGPPRLPPRPHQSLAVSPCGPAPENAAHLPSHRVHDALLVQVRHRPRDVNGGVQHRAQVHQHWRRGLLLLRPARLLSQATDLGQ